jgi:hypothetical protein
LQVRVGLNDHVGAGRAGHVETKLETSHCLRPRSYRRNFMP